jgi:hypothetical protein
MTETVPRPTDERLAADDREANEMQAQIQHNERVAERLRYLRVDRDARARFQAELAAATSYDDQYLDRAGLLDLPSPEPLIERVIPRHAYGILRGRDHSLKTFVALDWALCLATGKPWQGHEVQPARVLYIAGEGTHGLAKRVEAWEYGWGHNVPPDQFTLRRSGLNLHQPGPAFDDLLGRIRDGGYGLVIVDTLRRVSGAADGNSSEMGLVIDNLDRIKQATAEGTVLAVAHTDKGDHDTRGYSGIEDDADFVWAAKRDDMYLTLELTKMKDGPDGRTIQLLASRTLASLTLSGITGPPKVNTTESQAKILTTLDGVPNSVLLKATGLPDSTYYRAIKELHTTGHVLNIGTPTRKIWALPALNPDSHEPPQDETPSNQGVSHNSHDSQTQLPLTPTTPTTLRSGSGERERENSSNDTTKDTP